MTHSIGNSLLSVTIQQEGVEISSLKSLKTNTEYIWNAEPTVWGSHAPVLFPIIGALRNGNCQIEGKSYQIPKHGIIRHNESLRLVSQGDNHLSFELSSSPESLKTYPYKFIFRITYQLEANKLIVSHLVQNTDIKDIYFALGAHPAFNCPFKQGENYEDYYLEFQHLETASRWMLNDKGLLSGEKLPYLKATKHLNLKTDMFKEDALVFTDLQSRELSLKSKKSKQSIKVSFANFPFLGLWAKPNANFICIEPWQGLTDSEQSTGIFQEKMGLVNLKANDSYKAQYSIAIEE